MQCHTSLINVQLLGMPTFGELRRCLNMVSIFYPFLHNAATLRNIILGTVKLLDMTSINYLHRRIRILQILNLT